ncbi:unnamed protein product [Spirodela intermedia]|uniref:RRM domain-containing protein n=1 Tax=Spirodela intermedia TaxID=51605 RepID=A0A7I8JJ90_SPIIN|nr:unnamed protein product [Spirodela intermedia]CAA6669855.1 unnamed protein product [Spirodela intermedia]
MLGAAQVFSANLAISLNSASSSFAPQPTSAHFPRASHAKEFPPASRIFVRIKIARDEDTKKPKGYAFVQYSSQDEAVLALEHMDGKIIDGRAIFVEIAKPSCKRISCYPITSGPPQSTPKKPSNLASVDGTSEVRRMIISQSASLLRWWLCSHHLFCKNEDGCHVE